MIERRGFNSERVIPQRARELYRGDICQIAECQDRPAFVVQDLDTGFLDRLTVDLLRLVKQADEQVVVSNIAIRIGEIQRHDVGVQQDTWFERIELKLFSLRKAFFEISSIRKIPLQMLIQKLLEGNFWYALR